MREMFDTSNYDPAKPLFSNKYKKVPGKFKDELSGIFKRNISFYISDNRVYLSNNRFVIVFSNIWRKKNKINNVEKNMITKTFVKKLIVIIYYEK